jgi:hypothetical protein
MKKKIAALVVAGTLVMLAGCENEEATTEETTELTTTEIVQVATVEDATPDETEQLKTIGKEAEDGFEVYLTNQTGQNITDFEIYDSVSDEYSENLLDTDDVFIDGEERILYYEEVSEDTESNQNSDEKLISVGYDIKIVLEDETEYVLHSFPFGEIETGAILVEDEVAYVEYDDYSTKEAELAIKEADEAAAAIDSAPAVSKPVATEAPAATMAPAATEAPAVTEAQTEAPVVTEAPVITEAPETEAPSVEQNDENCIGDDGLTY